MKKINLTGYTINIVEILKILDSVSVKWTDQLAVTSRTGNNLLDGIGSITNYPDNLERDFCKLNDLFKNSSIENLLNKLHSDGYTHGRVRIMRMNSKSVYTYHMDCETRLHFALKTNSKAMFIIDDEVFRIPADGYGYLLNTTLPHTAINASLEERIHLVIDLLIPVKKVISNENTKYSLLNKILTEDEFNQWLIETKPYTEASRMDYYFTD